MLTFSRYACLVVLLGVLIAGVHTQAQAQNSQADLDAAFAAVLAAPDSLDANINYLQAQLDAGDLEGASTTLQRILLLNPGFDDARLVRVAVLLRLGDDAGAQADLNFLDERPLSDSQRAEADRLAAHVGSSPSDLELAGVWRTGILYSSNPGFRPGTFTINGQAYDFPSEDEAGAFTQLEVSLEQPLGGEGHSLRAHVMGYASEYLDDQRGVAAARLALGPRVDLGFAYFDIMGVLGAHFVGGHHYGHDLGGRAELTVDVSDQLSASLRVEAGHEALDVNLFSSTFLGDADGTRYSVTPSISYRMSSQWDVTAHAYYGGKDADSAWYSYDAFEGGVSVRYRDTTGYQVRVGVSARDISYDAINPDVVPANVAREETRLGLDLSMAAPFSLILEKMGQDETQAWAADWSLEAFTRYDVNQSNIAVYDSSNLTVGLSVARRFSM